MPTGSQNFPEKAKADKDRPSCDIASTTGPADQSLTSPSLADRARVFDKSYQESSRTKGANNPLQALLDASGHRRTSKVINGRRSTYRDTSNPGTPCEIIEESPRFDPDHRKKVNVSDDRTRTNFITRDHVDEQPVKLGASMQKLLDESNHKKLMKISKEHRLANRMMQSSEHSDDSQYDLPLFTFNVRKGKHRFKPALAGGVLPLKPTETTFPNVMAPKLTVDVETFEVPVHPKSVPQTTLLLDAMASTYVLKNQAPATCQALVEAMEPLEYRKGQIVLLQGDSSPDADQFYVVEEGHLQVQVDGKSIRIIEAGETFGQERLLYRSGANQVTLRAGSAITKVLSLHQVTFRVLQLQHYRRVLDELQAKTPKIHASTTWRDDIHKDQTNEEYSCADYEYDEDNDEELYADEIISHDDTEAVVGTLPFAKPRTLVSPSHVAPATDQMLTGLAASKITSRPDRKSHAFSILDSPIFQKQEAWRRSVRKHAPSVDELEFIKILGEGQFGKVWLVAANIPDHDPPRQEFALKIQEVVVEDEVNEDLDNDEKRMVRFDSIRREVRTLHDLHHPFICNLVHTYETENSLDLLLGVVPGGELWETIHREQEDGTWLSGMPEGQARFYTYVLTNALGFMHSRHYIYRDLKPENVLLDAGEWYMLHLRAVV